MTYEMPQASAGFWGWLHEIYLRINVPKKPILNIHRPNIKKPKIKTGSNLKTTNSKTKIVQNNEPPLISKNTVVSSGGNDDSPFGFLKSPDSEKYFSDLGVKWTRTVAQWGLAQTKSTFEDGVYNWEAIESRWQMEEHSNDLNWVITVSFLGTNITQDTGSYVPSVYPYNKENYLLYVENLVNRYKDKVKFFQVENEPKREAKDFAELQKITYNKIKEVCSDCHVLIAGHALGAGQEKTFDSNMLTILKELDGNYVDIFDIHWFGSKDDSNVMDPARESDGNLNIDIIKQKLKQTNFGDIDIWITESGTYSGSPLQKEYQSEAEQASSVIKRYVSPLAKGVKKIMWAWGTTESFKKDCNFFDYTGLVYDGCDCNDSGKYVCPSTTGDDLGTGVKKLGYYTFKQMTQKLEGSDWDNIEIIQESNDIYVYKFKNKTTGKSTWVAWSDSGSGSVSLSSLGITTNAKVIDAVPDYANGKEIENIAFENMFQEFVVDSSIKLWDVPVFVEETNDTNLKPQVKSSITPKSQPTQNVLPSNNTRPNNTRPQQGKCGDGTCDEMEKSRGLCPEDCSTFNSRPTTRPINNTGPQGKCGDGICDNMEKANPRLCPGDC